MSWRGVGELICDASKSVTASNERPCATNHSGLGQRYVSKVLSITLPAILAPGNLPALCENFQVELVIVTESRLFDTVEASSVFQTAAKICATRLIPLDDLLTDVPSDYGMVLTYALFRGFADLGVRAIETYLVLLNADFVISDGSLRHLGKLMSEGHRVIHAPSFRVVLEDVWRNCRPRQISRHATCKCRHAIWRDWRWGTNIRQSKCERSTSGSVINIGWTSITGMSTKTR